MTAREQIRKHQTWYTHTSEETGEMVVTTEDAEAAMVEFAQFHVKAAIRELTRSEYDRVASEKVIDELTEEALTNTYPLTNIQ